jgi:hypothetical protein
VLFSRRSQCGPFDIGLILMLIWPDGRATVRR